MWTIAIAIVGVLAATAAFARPRRLQDDDQPDHQQPDQEQQRSGGTPPSSISVIVPARNEAANLPDLLESLARSELRPFEIIVVDDGSIDATAEVAQAYGARLICAPPLPTGWVGKNWACHIGATESAGEHLLFLDADTRVSPTALTALKRTHHQRGGLVSVQPFHRPVSRYEELSALFNAVSLLGTGAFAARSTTPQRMAFGPCLFSSSSDHRAIGGHQAVRTEVVEDIALAERYADHGLAVTCLLGGELVWFRMYPDGLRTLIQGWTKNIALGAGRAPAVPTALAVTWVAALAAVAVATATGIVGWIVGGSAPTLAVIAWLMMAVHLRLLLTRIGAFRTLTSALYVVPLAFFLAVFGRSALIARRRSTAVWRGREVSLRAADVHPDADG